MLKLLLTLITFVSSSSNLQTAIADEKARMDQEQLQTKELSASEGYQARSKLFILHYAIDEKIKEFRQFEDVDGKKVKEFEEWVRAHRKEFFRTD